MTKPLRYKVSLSNDLSIGSVAGLNAHGWNVPPATPVPAAPAFEYPLPNFWPPGSCMGQNKLTKRVTHRKAAIVQDGHDVGMMIPHISIPAWNVLTPIHVLFSKRKTVFFEPSVRFEKRFAAPCSALGLPPTPMMSCNDPITMPIASVVTDFRNTVEFGMSWESYATSCTMMAITVLVDKCFARPPTAAASGVELLKKQLGQKLSGGRDAQTILTKLGLEAAIGLGKLGLTSGERTVSMPMPGGPFVRWSATVDANGEVSAKATLHGFSNDGSSAWDETRARMGHEGPWGADLG